MPRSKFAVCEARGSWVQAGASLPSLPSLWLGGMEASDEAGPMVRLISAEGHEFYVHKKCALVSGTIKAMLGGQFAESRGEVRFFCCCTFFLARICVLVLLCTPMYVSSC